MNTLTTTRDINAAIRQNEGARGNPVYCSIDGAPYALRVLPAAFG